MTSDDPYRVLGVLRKASADEIRAAFWATMRRQHPDVAGADTDNAGTRRVFSTYRLLATNLARSLRRLSHEHRRR